MAFSPLRKIKGWAEEWVNAGLDASRAVKNVKAVFDESAPSVTKWADTTAAAFGMTAADAEKAAAKVWRGSGRLRPL